MTFREKLIVLRDKAGISQMSLAHQLDVSRQAVSRWESGDTTPSMDKLRINIIKSPIGQAEGAGEDLRCIPRLAVQ